MADFEAAVEDAELDEQRFDAIREAVAARRPA
jgi:hypothetical protein